MRRTDNRNRQGGFTLIEVLVTIVIFGIIFALIIPHLLDSLQKGKQKRTVSDVRDVGVAWYSWLTDQMSAAAAGSTGGRFDFTRLGSALTAAQLLDTLYDDTSHFYIQTVPGYDSWGHDYEYAWSAQLSYAEIIGIRSLGRDGVEGPSTNPYTMGPFNSTKYDEDIVWADGLFIRFPLGGQVQ